VNITDNQTAVVRMSSLGASVIAIQEGLEPVMQMTCRDRNRLAMQADFLSAYALGVRNMLALTGDHQSFGDHPRAKGVFDIDSIQLIQMVKQMVADMTVSIDAARLLVYRLGRLMDADVGRLIGVRRGGEILLAQLAGGEGVYLFVSFEKDRRILFTLQCDVAQSLGEFALDRTHDLFV